MGTPLFMGYRFWPSDMRDGLAFVSLASDTDDNISVGLLALKNALD